MKKSIYEKDYLVSRLISMDKQVDGYTKIYYQANENLIDYLDVDFSDKRVFSVLASSDQVLTARYLDAKNVDSFDFNRLTLYYYYLRIWSIKYANSLYPQVLNNNQWLINLLKLVKPNSKEEKEALFFFIKHIKYHTDISRLFFDIDAQPIGKTIYTKPEELIDYIDQPLNFHHIDLFKPFELPSTYDILLISNILEWARGDKTKLQIAHDNISRLLSTDGTIICSNLINRSLAQEQQIFSDYEYEKVGTTYIYKRK